jgi:hypothetical protein
MARILARLAVALVASVPCGCNASPCTESSLAGTGAVGTPCVTTRDCGEGLMCIGSNIEEDATCAPFSELPGGTDPGCLPHASDWEEHGSDGVRPPSTDEDGCEILVFESACNCVGSLGDGGCLPTFPVYRTETWRSCRGCCWRLVAFQLDPSACD